MIEINGMAHVVLSVSEWDRCRAFYGALLPFLGMRHVFSGEDTVYHVGGRTALMITRCGEGHGGERFDQRRVGLHHLCFRCRSAGDIDRLHAFLLDLGARIVRAPEIGPWAPGYYSVRYCHSNRGWWGQGNGARLAR
jgi:catechol 2,3-dioxygenase-like lactoylglutathione lyase family enzyme